MLALKYHADFLRVLYCYRHSLQLDISHEVRLEIVFIFTVEIALVIHTHLLLISPGTYSS